MGKKSRKKKGTPSTSKADATPEFSPPQIAWLWHAATAALVAAALALIYGAVLNSPFQFDDHRTVVSNLSLRELSNWGAMFRFAPSRFLLTLSFALDYRFGQLDPWHYHLSNLVLHGLNALAVYAIVLSGALGRAVSRYGYALAAALLFTVHPFNSETAIYISSRSSSLSMLFVLLSFWAFVRFLQKPGALRWCAAFAFFLLGLPTKETAATLPLVLLLYLAVWKSENGFFTMLRARGKALAPFFAVPVLGLVARTLVAGAPLSTVVRPWGIHVVTQCKVFFLNLGLYLFPRGLSIEHDVAQGGAGSTVAFMGLATAFAVAWRYRKTAPGLVFGFGFAFVTYLPLMLVPLQDLMTEQWAYLSNTGWLLAALWLVAAGLERVKNSAFARRASGALAVLLVLVLGFAAHAQSKVWETDVTLWTNAARVSPGKGRPYVNLAAGHFVRGNFDQALENYEKAASRPGAFLPRVYLGMGRIYFEHKKDLANAEKYFRLATETGPEVWDAWARLGYVYREKGDCPAAITVMEKVRQRARENAMLQFMLGDCYLSVGEKAKAEEQFLWVLQIEPGDFFTCVRLGQLYESQGRWADALSYYERAQKIRPRDEMPARRIRFIQRKIWDANDSAP